MNKKVKRGLLVSVLTLCFIVAAALPGVAAQAQQYDGATITVSGVGEILLEPDIVTVSVTVSTTEESPAAALRLNNSTTRAVIAALRASGIDADDITTSNFWLHPVMSWRDGEPEVVGHTVSNDLRIIIRDLDMVGDVLTTATTAGATSVGNVQFGVEDAGDAYNQALALAVRSARSKADAIAAAAGMRVTGIVSIVEHVGWQPPVVARETFAQDAVAAPAAGSVPVYAGDLAVRAQVQIVFSMG